MAIDLGSNRRLRYNIYLIGLVTEVISGYTVPTLKDRSLRMPSKSHRPIVSRRFQINQAKVGSANRASLKRFKNRLRRKHKVDMKRQISIRHSKYILNALISGQPTTPMRRKRRDATQHIRRIPVRNFSLIDYPDETLKTLSDIAVADKLGNKYFLDFHDKHCRDIGPFLIFGLMRQEMETICMGGTIEPPIATVLNAVQLGTFLRMKFRNVSTDAAQKIFPFRLKRQPALHTYASGFESHHSAKEKHTEGFVNMLNDGLRQASMQLSSEGGNKIKCLIAEILDNSRHANPVGDDGEWAIAGFMESTEAEDGNLLFTCHLAIATVGVTISKTLLQCQDSNILDMLDGYANSHKFASSKYDEDTLVTLCALIDTVSCEGRGKGKGFGGCGMSCLIQMLQAIGTSSIPDKEPRIIVISGKSCIRLIPPYNDMISSSDLDGVCYQAFNHQQNLEIPPDDKFVYTLSHQFPGTIISLRFTIDPEEIRRLLSI